MLPSAPAFLIQQTYQGRKLLVPVGSACEAIGLNPPGIALDFGAVPLSGVREDASSHGSLAPLLAGSAVYDTEAKHRTPMAQWVQRKAPETRAEWDKTIADCLGEQRRLRTDALSVPGVELSASGYPNGLERQTDALRRAWRGRPSGDAPWFARLCLHDDWLTDRGLQRFLLNVITDLPDKVGIALHVRFARRDAASDADSLTGLREVVRVLADDDRRVLLLQTGLIGWLGIAWGAWGFSAGLSQASWLDTRAIIRRRAGTPSPPRLERYLEPQLLHSVLSADHLLLAQQAGYMQCTCAFCQGLGGGWNPKSASQHDLLTLAKLTQAVTAPDRTARREAVRRSLESAQNHWASWANTSGLSTRAEPKHLAVWRSLV
jgi:hypothetical protein